MKKNYVTPVIENIILNANQCVMAAVSGEIDDDPVKTGEAKISFDNDEE